MTFAELAVCLVTIDPMAYVPLSFFAAALTFIGKADHRAHLHILQENVPCGFSFFIPLPPNDAV